MFPPGDTTYLYPTRLPFEESSVFSGVNIQNPCYSLFPKYKVGWIRSLDVSVVIHLLINLNLTYGNSIWPVSQESQMTHTAKLKPCLSHHMYSIPTTFAVLWRRGRIFIEFKLHQISSIGIPKLSVWPDFTAKVV